MFHVKHRPRGAALALLAMFHVKHRGALALTWPVRHWLAFRSATWYLVVGCAGLWMGRVIAVANQKGGVGKTTTAVNLSAALALTNHRTLLIDLDAQGSASSGLGASPRGRHTVYDLLTSELPAAAVLCPTELAELDIIPADRDLAGAEVELVGLDSRESRLRSKIGEIRTGYDYVVIDCPPSLGMLTLNALSAADSVLIPLQCEYYALEGLTNLLDTVEKIRARFNEDLVLEGILLTMFDARTSLSRQVADQVRSHFKAMVFRTVVPRNVRISESPSHGLPVLLYDPASKGAQAYGQLAQELVEKYLITTSAINIRGVCN